MSYVGPSIPQSIGGVLADSLRLFRNSFSRCWVLAAIATLPAVLLIFGFRPLLPVRTMTLWHLVQFTAALDRPKNPIADAAMLLIDLAVGGALLAQQVATSRSQSLPFAEALLTGMRRLPRMVLVLLLMTLASVAMMIGCIPIAVAIFIAARLGHFSARDHVLPLIFGMPFMAGVIYLMVRTALSLPAIFMEGDGAMAAMRRSWRMMRGYWWRTAVIMAIPAVLMSVLGFAGSSLIGLEFGVLGAKTVGSAAPIFPLRLIQVCSQAMRIMTAPLSASVLLAIYHDLKLRSEGAAVVARGGGPDPA
jgi:hypothetical protein